MLSCYIEVSDWQKDYYSAIAKYVYIFIDGRIIRSQLHNN